MPLHQVVFSWAYNDAQSLGNARRNGVFACRLVSLGVRLNFKKTIHKRSIMDTAQKKAGPHDSLSRGEQASNKQRTHVVRRQFDQSYLDPDSIKSALVSGQWMDPIGTIHDADDDPVEAYR